LTSSTKLLQDGATWIMIELHPQNRMENNQEGILPEDKSNVLTVKLHKNIVV
jgi:hypothetical protein